jgi:hypothetical protein
VRLYDTRQRLLSLAAAMAAQEKTVQKSIIAAMKIDAEPGADNERWPLSGSRCRRR